MPASRAYSQSPLISPSTSTSSRLSASANKARLRTSRAVCFCSGERSFSSVPNAVPMRPISLCAPVAVTRQRVPLHDQRAGVDRRQVVTARRNPSGVRMPRRDRQFIGLRYTLAHRNGLAG